MSEAADFIPGLACFCLLCCFTFMNRLVCLVSFLLVVRLSKYNVWILFIRILFFFSFVIWKFQCPRWRWQCIARPPGYRRACGLRECGLASFPFWVARRWGRTAADVLLSDCQDGKGPALYGRCRVWNTGDSWGGCGLSLWQGPSIFNVSVSPLLRRCWCLCVCWLLRWWHGVPRGFWGLD